MIFLHYDFSIIIITQCIIILQYYFCSDSDQHELPPEVNKNGPFPYIVTLRDGQVSLNGIHTTLLFILLYIILFLLSIAKWLPY